MIVDLLSTFLGGGAGRAALRLHGSLSDQGIASRLWFARGDDCDDPRVARADWGEPQTWFGRTSNKVRQKLQLNLATRGRPAGLELFSIVNQPTPQCFPLAELQSDVIHLHWIAKFIDYPSFFASVPDDLPIVWTLHDMNPFTGGCHYSGGCDSFVSGCHSCPQLGRSGPRDLSQRTFAQKQAALRNKNIHVVAPSQWLTEEAARSEILGHASSIQTIAYGLDLDTWRPIDRARARAELGIDADENRPVIAFGAESLENHRKGFHLLLQALDQLSTPTVALAFGGGKIAHQGGQSQVLEQGFIHDANVQSALYSAADVFIMPSLEENLGTTSLESLACGTPVVAFDVGGTKDMVRDKVTGRLAKVGDVDDLTNKIEWLLRNEQDRQKMGEQARQMMLAEFNEVYQTQKYIDLYQEITAPWRREAA